MSEAELFDREALNNKLQRIMGSVLSSDTGIDQFIPAERPVALQLVVDNTVHPPAQQRGEVDSYYGY